MKAFSISTLKRMSAAEIRSQLPCILTSDNKPVCVCSDPDEVVVIQDFAPLVKKQFKAREALVRKGMPPVIYESYSENREALEEEAKEE